ncbi:ParB N-terminal domain-containing protein [Actinomadura fibrosa]|uniref:ParB N-terminal domain-containing protein n=1 Tax=Actinomadura fibrosa TaxID=111802 RepID=A0ABW2XX07_9ACTN|nr:ParB N-terminal domain-containing protein [Actinomadura fibrosa]
MSRDELLAMMPEVLKQTLPLVPWKIERLWRLELPVRRVAVQELAWLFDLPLWQLNGERFRVAPRQVRDDPQRYPDHLRRVMASDLNYPIHLVEHNGRLVVLDGFHRLLKASIEGRTEVEAVVLSPTDLRSICAGRP